MKGKEPYKLEKLQYNVKFEVNKIFSNNQLQEISNNPLQAGEIFRKNLLEGLRRYPEAILGRNLINELQQWLSKEDIKGYIEQAKIRAPLHLLQNFNELGIYYNNQEKKEIVLEFSNSDPDSVFATFKKPEIHLLFTKNERRKILLQCVEKGIGIFCDKEKIEEYEKSLFISKDDVKNIVLLLIYKNSHTKIIMEREWLISLFTEGNERDTLRKYIINSYNDKKSIRHIDDLNYLDQILSIEDKKDIIRKKIQNDQYTFIGYRNEIKNILGDTEYYKTANDFYKVAILNDNPYLKELTIKEVLEEGIEIGNRDGIINIITEQKPETIFESLELYLNAYPDIDNEVLVRDLIRKTKAEICLSYLSKWEQYIPIDKEILLEELRERKESEFKQELFETNKFKDLFPIFYDKELQLKLTNEEIQELKKRAFSIVGDHYFSKYDVENLNKSGGELAIKNFFEEVRKHSPSRLISTLEIIGYLYSKEEIYSIISDTIKTRKGALATICTIKGYIYLIDESKAKELILYFINNYPSNSLETLDNWKNFFGTKELIEVIDYLVIQDPMSALLKTRKLQNIDDKFSYDYLISIGKNNQERNSVIPNTLSNMYKEIESEQNELRREILLQKGSLIYQKIIDLENLKCIDIAKSIIENEGTKEKIENKVVSGIIALGLLKEEDGINLHELLKNIGNYNEIYQLLLKEVALKLEIKEELNGNKFIETMGEIEPLIIYLSQYKNSENHLKVLKEIFLSINNGRFYDYKYGEDSPEELESLKGKKLVPNKITYEQYQAWRKDLSSNLHESISGSAEEISIFIRTLLIENNNHLNVETFEDIDEMQNIIPQIQERLQELGPELGRVGKRIGEIDLLKSNGELQDKQKNELLNLENEKRKLLEEKENLQRNLLFIRLANLKPNEIASGYLYVGDKKDMKLSQAIKKLQDASGSDSQFIFTQIKNLLAGINEIGTQQKQNLTCEDTGNPKITLEIGENPVPSCQSYYYGEYNNCLLGYFDPNNKIIVLRNEKGNIIARSVLRLLEDNSGNPILHLEKIYSTSPSKSITNLITQHAYSKAISMGAPLYISKSNVEGGNKSSFNYINDKQSFYSQGSKAPNSYVDSAGGERSFGKFSISGALKVEKK